MQSGEKLASIRINDIVKYRRSDGEERYVPVCGFRTHQTGVVLLAHKQNVEIPLSAVLSRFRRGEPELIFGE